MMQIYDIIFGILSNTCPRCQQGKVFSSFIKMNADCPACGFHFEREPGYFLGAMSFSYMLGFISVLPVFLLLLLSGYRLPYVVGIPALVITPLAPVYFRISRLLWIYLDNRVSPKETGQDKTP